MCGIMGMVLGKRRRTEMELEELRCDYLDLLVATEARGTDAVGGFVLNPRGVRYHKTAGSASQSINWDGKMWALMDQISNKTTAVIGHTRLATLGCPTCNDNNHPLISRALIGVHNGMIGNHDEIRKSYPYKAEVDSGAIFSLLSAKAVNPLTTDIMVKALPELSGSMAIAVADRRKTGSVFIARNSTSPLVLRRDTKRDVLWIASTVSILNEGLFGSATTTKRSSHVPNNVIAELTRDHASGKKINYVSWTPKPEPKFSFSRRAFTFQPAIRNDSWYGDAWETWVNGNRIR